MIVYAFAPTTGEYIGPDVAFESPLEPGHFLDPANTTRIAPPAAQEGKARVWNGSAWSLVPDHRGQVWYGGQDGRQPLRIVGLGDPTLEGLTPAPAALTVEETRARLVALAGRKRRQAEEGGTTVEGGRFETDRTTQQMLTSAVLAAQVVGGPTVFQWKTADGFVSLTADQVRAIALAVSQHVQACFAAEAELVAAIGAGIVTTEDAVHAFAWPS